MTSFVIDAFQVMMTDCQERMKLDCEIERSIDLFAKVNLDSRSNFVILRKNKEGRKKEGRKKERKKERERRKEK